jgi:hypothetical protein
MVPQVVVSPGALVACHSVGRAGGCFWIVLSLAALVWGQCFRLAFRIKNDNDVRVAHWYFRIASTVSSDDGVIAYLSNRLYESVDNLRVITAGEPAQLSRQENV